MTGPGHSDHRLSGIYHWLLNSEALPDREIAGILGLVQGNTVFGIWPGKDPSAIARLIVGSEVTEYTATNT